jgi:hypothetical protein
MNDFITEVILWALASPILLVRQLVRLWRQWQFWKMAYTPGIHCRNCGASVSLVGQWECSCKFVYQGHLLRRCPICGSMPRFVRCYQCRVTEELPDLSD